jgi:hypothetical protein
VVSRRGPFDFAQGKPFDFAQGKPFDFAQGKPFDFAQGKPFDLAGTSLRKVRAALRMTWVDGVVGLAPGAQLTI